MTIVSHVATHYHWDHIGSADVNGVRVPGINDWAAKGLPVYVPTVELAMAAQQTAVSPDVLTPLSNGQCLAVGRFGVEVIDTPGHSPGSSCLRVTDGVPHGVAAEGLVRDLLLVTGDTVFPGSCGRLVSLPCKLEAMCDLLTYYHR
jgi:glyoxylase-like metal-dependent hydrolase (beta-lactamase superfamily II)